METDSTLTTFTSQADGRVNVWLTSMYAFRPERWGMLSFTYSNHRTGFLNSTTPGAIVCVYITKQRAVFPEEAGKLVGFYEVSHEIGDAKNFIHPEDYARKQASATERYQWNFAVRATRAWRIPKPFQPLIGKIAQDTYNPMQGSLLAGLGKRLSPEDAERIMMLPVEEVPVFGGLEFYDPDEAEPLAQKIRRPLRPSRAVSRALEPYLMPEEEGPRRLYMLELEGDLSAFLGRPRTKIEGLRIIKVGYSKEPTTRLRCFNNAMPECAFKWKLARITKKEEQLESSIQAAEYEEKMKDVLEKYGAESLGGEFFLADYRQIEKAWRAGEVKK